MTGDATGMSKTRLYHIWKDMKRRCSNPTRDDYKYYGGRGITVCEEWLEFRNFAVWALQSGYTTFLTLERVDVNGNYEPDNCEWIPWKDQFLNQTKSRILTAFGETKSLAAWARDGRCVVGYGTLKSRVDLGWSVERAITALPWSRSDRG